MADWSENRHQVDAGNDQVVTVPDAAIVPDIFKQCKEKVSFSYVSITILLRSLFCLIASKEHVFRNGM